MARGNSRERGWKGQRSFALLRMSVLIHMGGYFPMQKREKMRDRMASSNSRGVVMSAKVR